MASNATVGSLRVVLGLDSAAFTEGLTAAQKHLKSAGARMQSVGTTMAAVGAGLTATVSAPLAALGVSFTNAAIDAQEMQSAFDVSFGAMAQATRKWAEDTGNALGRSTFELQEMALGFNGLFKAGGPVTQMSADMARQFTVLAQDLSSFHNVAEQDVFQALRSGLSGEAEPLRRFNVYLTEAAVKAEGLRLGLQTVGGELTEQAKIQARASLILKGTAEAQGDVARTSESAANQLRTLKSQWAEISVTLGSAILPAVMPVISGLADMAKGFAGLSPAMQQVTLIGGAVAAALGPIIVAAGAIVSSLGVLLPVLGTIGAPFLAFAAAAAAVGTALFVFRDELIPIIQSFAASVQENIGPKLMPLWDALVGAVRAVGEVFIAILGDGSPESAAATLKAFGEVVSRIFGAAVDLITGAVNIITNILRALAALLRGDFSTMWNALGSAVQALVTGVLNAFETLFPGVIGSVQKLVEGVTTWLRERLGQVLGWVIGKVREVGDAFFKLYDAVVGHSYIPDMVEEIGEWIAKLQGNMVSPIEAMTGDAARAFDGMSSDVNATLDGLFKSLGSKDWKGALGSLFELGGSVGGGRFSKWADIGKSVMNAFGSGLPGFKTGGSFTVGGARGVDSSLVAFRATPGEMVDVRRPGQLTRAGDGTPVMFDLRGAVMTADLLSQMEVMAAESGGAAFSGARQTVPSDLARRNRYSLGRRG